MSLNLLSKSKKLHFIGIGGAGMSAIAKVILEMGFPVSGSDLKESRYTRVLSEMGADISIGHDVENLNEVSAVVISSAIPDRNPELKAARECGINVLARAQMLGELCKQKDQAIAIAGTHGKTTTTSMTALILEKAGMNPTFLIGGELNDIGSNAKYGTGDTYVVEADESDGSLVYIKPKYAVITNIDTDHLDYHQTFDQLMDLFKNWISNLAPGGRAIVWGDGSVSETVAKSSGCSYTSFGVADANDLSYFDTAYTDFGSEFTVRDRGSGQTYRMKLKVPGEHNILNALAAMATAQSLGIDISESGRSLSEFNGVKRRFQLLGRGRDISVIDDYAHHPTEVTATLKAIRNGDWKRVICVFQPHRFSRTKLLSTQFGAAFLDADITVMTDVYNAGELPVPGVSGKLLVDEILTYRPHSRIAYVPNKIEIKDYLLSIIRPGDVVLTLGAGDVWTIGVELCEQILSS